MDHTYQIYADPKEMALAATHFFVDFCKRHLRIKDKISICLSGGSTPKAMFKLLAADPFREQLDWYKIHFFWGDERNVPQSDKESNSGEAIRLLFDKIPIPEENIHAINTDLEPATAALDYEYEIKSYFEGNKPAFDLCFLGMGDDGHTASLFPFTTILYEEDSLVKSVYVEKLNAHRISITPTLINQSLFIAFLIAGKNKADVVQKVIEGDFDPEKYPSQLVVRTGGSPLVFYMDEAAASRLELDTLA